MKLFEIITTLEKFAPKSFQESYDNSGLLFGNKDENIKKILICVDITEEVIDEAISNDCNLIISHHPLVFTPIKNLTGNNFVERCLIKAVQNNICLYAAHTNLDNVYAGVNGYLANRFELINTRILSPKNDLLNKIVTFCPVNHAQNVREKMFEAGAGYIGDYDMCSFNIEGTGTFRGLDNSNPFVGKKGEQHFEKELRIEMIFPSFLQKKIVDAMIDAHPYEEVAYDVYPLNNIFDRVGSGIIGQLKESLREKDFLVSVKKQLQCSLVKHTSFRHRKIQKVAICGGSGSFLIRNAINSGADAFVTGDLKYHDYFQAEGKILLIDAGHYETEQFTKELIYNFLIEKFPTFAIQISEVNTNPIRYF